ncbi:hypothetical protein Syun_011668 [Stephania yunnanensis]|uniref:S-protein homolog n=1 Tax=Stephania yunnanensis TaxID=152371 RepID=A0AAP0PEK1_9MAGN
MEQYCYMGNKRLAFASAVFLLILVAEIECRNVDPNGLINIKRHVHVQNDISPAAKINLHCKSKDDDLGPQVLAYQQEFTWKFRGNIFATTLFWCNMDWTDPKGVVFPQSFVAYESKVTRCGKDCLWSARPDGLYFHDDDIGDFVLKFIWDNS